VNFKSRVLERKEKHKQKFDREHEGKNQLGGWVEKGERYENALYVNK
jgi:hypothetical protein